MATPDFTAGSVMLGSAALLNDTQLQVYTYAVQIPFLKLALQELREYLEVSNIPVTNFTNTVLTIAANTTVISFITTPALPIDLANPRQVWESRAGQNQYVPMQRREFIPIRLTGITQSQFGIWAWVNNSIHVPACNQSNDLKIDYVREITAIVDENSQLTIVNGLTFLQYRTAALCAEYIGENKTRADDLNLNAQGALDRSVSIESKAKQSILTRRKPFRHGFKSRGYF